jgi:3-oxoacid CoA-transferase subunit A
LNKVFGSAGEALSGVLHDGLTLMVGGFGPCGIPEASIEAILESGVRELSVISCDCGAADFGVGRLIAEKRVRTLTAAYVGDNRVFAEQYLAGEIELELCPMGNLVEKIRSAGAGIAGFFTRTGVGTLAAEGKEHRTFDGVDYYLETALSADLAIVRATTADAMGNLHFRKVTANFNSVMCAAAKMTVVEVQRIVAPGGIDPDCVDGPGIYVDRIFQATPSGRIERLMLRSGARSGSSV